MSVPSLRLEYRGRADLVADLEQNLQKGRAFVPAEPNLNELDRCDLVLVHPDSQVTLTIAAEVVWVKRDEPTGFGLALAAAGPALVERIRAFVETAAPEAIDGAEAPGEGGGAGARGANLYDRIRALSTRDREALARQGAMHERVALERVYGGAVWEGLLQNPQLTPPEVARIARNGTIPKPLVGVVAMNGAWISNAEVQRALLGNPRCEGANLDRVLRAMRPADLDLVAKTGAYRAAVRSAAARLRGK